MPSLPGFGRNVARPFEGEAGSQCDNEANQRVRPVSDSGAGAALRLRSILASCGLTLHQVALASNHLYGPESPFRIPHTLCHSLANSPSFNLSISQTCALSRISRYRLEDWLGALGIKLEMLAGLQVVLPFGRTRLIDPLLHGTEPLAHGLTAEAGDRSPTDIAPFGQLFHRVSAPPSSGEGLQEQQALFARIGAEDAFSFPELLPGSIVRLIAGDRQLREIERRCFSQPRLLIVKYQGGLWSGRFRLSKDSILHAVPTELAYAPISLRYPQEARILGRVDMEIRWMHRFDTPRVPPKLAVRHHSQALDADASSPGDLILRARRRAGLTLEQAARHSRTVAQVLNDERYAIAQSTLSDYEVQSAPPRHLEKAMTLCLIYGISLIDFVTAAGAAPDSLGQRPIPREFLPHSEIAALRGSRIQSVDRADLCASRMRQMGPIPWFLGSALAELSGIRQLSTRDFFWIAGDQPFLPAHTEGSLAALVDRRRKRPVRRPGLPAWIQPAYILLMRNGTYRCACCSLEGDTLILSPRPQSGIAPEEMRLGQDAEVIGQIIALARHIA